MTKYTQENRPLLVHTPIGDDALLLVGFAGHEAISELFDFQLDLMAEDATKVKFEKLLGQKITVTLTLPDESTRYFSGFCNRMSQGGRSEGDVFTYYRMEIVPQFWFLTKRVQSRIFQHLSVPDILKKVLDGLDVEYQIQGTFQPRDYCVQYRESDFNFASRLMEEEGIYYFFKHSADGHKMVVANTPQGHGIFDDPVQATIIYEEIFGGYRDENRILSWEKTQELRSGKYTLWDHCFEMPHQNLAAEVPTLEDLQVGTVEHKLKVGGNDKFEIYDYPGAYAQRFDGVSKGGGDQSGQLSNIFEDNQRTTKIRMEQETARGILIHGSSNCRHFVSGYKFTLDRHFDADGDYLLTSVHHTARLTSADYRSGEGGEFNYENTFTCIPFLLPFLPRQVIVKPTVHGTQTAVVVGPAGEEIFTDKYSRVKVQFMWDRQGKKDADSSCWIRVGTLWAGKQWGVIHIPRIGQEVIVDFLEGDPDQPIIVGSVYNAEQMPPYKLPDNKTQSGVKSRSSKSGTPANFNEFRFEDKKGHEQVYLHAEKNQDIEVENDETHWVGHDRTKRIDHDEFTQIGHDRTETVERNETITIQANRTETVDDNESISIGKNRTETVGKDETITIDENRTETVGKNETVSIGGDREHNIGKNDQLTVGKKIYVTAGDEITLNTGDASIIMKKDGTIQIKGKDISIIGSGQIVAKAASDVVIKGSKVLAN
jgi:type VI secretion system secreted protein VgrG